MVTNFEDITKPLTEDELKLVGLLVTSFQNRSKDNPIKAPEIITKMNVFLTNSCPHIKIKLSGPRLRKLCNHIRTNGMLPLIATSNGYYVSFDKKEILSQVQSLRDRADAIFKSSVGLEKFLTQ